MRLKIKCRVEKSADEVWKGFDEALFKKLSPPFPKVELARFDGSTKGDIVSLKLNFLFFSQEWTSEIIESGSNEGSYYFIDKGIKLPFFLSRWTHRHEINQLKTGTEIVDNIDFSTGTILTDLLMYPAMLGQFAYRIPVYKKYFKS